MIIGGHVMLQSKNVQADIAFFRDVLKFPNVDAGGGFLLFRLPSAEAAIHQSEKNDVHQLYLMCSNINDFIKEMKAADRHCGPVQEQGWGSVTEVSLPGGGKISVYQPHHPRP